MRRSLFLLIWLLLVLILKIPSRASFLLGIFFLLLASLAIALEHQGFGLRMTTYAFGLLFIGLISYLLELKNEKR